MKNSYCTIYLTRHGETSWNEKKLIQGQTDIPLNKKGELQAKQLGKRLKNIHFDAVFSSDLIRARRTAEIMILEKKLTVVTTKALRERHFGQYEGKNFRKFDTELHRLLEEYKEITQEHKDSGLEVDEALIGRYIPFLREISVAYAGKTVLIVTHGGVLRTFLIHLGFGSHDQLPSGCIDNLGYIKLDSDGVDFFIRETFGIRKNK